MNRSIARPALLVACLLSLTSSPVHAVEMTLDSGGNLLIARDNRNHHHRDGYRSRGHNGFDNLSHGINRGNRRPIGGWRNDRGDGDRLRRDLRHGDFDRLDRDWNKARDHLNRDWQRAGDRWDRWIDHGDRWPGWARQGWGLARPWNHGWYGNWNNKPPWGWWGARAAITGLGSLATAAVINNAVNEAITSNRTTIVVPDSNYQLNFGTIAPSSDQVVTFSASDGNRNVAMEANCQTGELSGKAPATAAEAQLMNAACQVAFGSA